MPISNDRKIISLAALSEFKTKQDTYNASKFVPYQNATGPVNLGEYAIYASEFSDSALGAGGSRIYFYEGDINISGAANVAVTTSNGDIFTYNGVEVATKADISSVLRFKGNATISELETLAAGTTLTSGDTYNITAAGQLDNVGSSHANDYPVNAGDNVAWVKPSSGQGYWDVLAGTLDTSNFVTSSQLSTALGNYLPLTAGSSKALSGSLYLKPTASSAPSLTVATGDLEIASPNKISFSSIDVIRLKSNNGSYWASLETDNLSADRAYNLPNESGTLVTGEYATYSGNGNDIASLFN